MADGDAGRLGARRAWLWIYNNDVRFHLFPRTPTPTTLPRPRSQGRSHRFQTKSAGKHVYSCHTVPRGAVREHRKSHAVLTWQPITVRPLEDGWCRLPLLTTVAAAHSVLLRCAGDQGEHRLHVIVTHLYGSL